MAKARKKQLKSPRKYKIFCDNYKSTLAWAEDEIAAAYQYAQKNLGIDVQKDNVHTLSCRIKRNLHISFFINSMCDERTVIVRNLYRPKNH